MGKRKTVVCEYCGQPADSENEAGESVCLACEYEHAVIDMVDFTPSCDPATGMSALWVMLGPGWCPNGTYVQSERLTMGQAKVLVKLLNEAIDRMVEYEKEYKR